MEGASGRQGWRAAQQDAIRTRRWLHRGAMRAAKAAAYVEDCGRHQVTANAPPLMETVGPTISSTAPFPFDKVMPVSPIEINAPLSVLS